MATSSVRGPLFAPAQESFPGDFAANMSFLATAPATQRERRFAAFVVGLSIAFLIAALPFAKVKLVQIPAFIPTYEAALIITDLVTAVLLLGQFMKLRSRAILALAAGYLFDALIIIPHALSFPGAFGPGGVIGGGSQTTAWLYTLWHAGFPLFVIAYALLKDSDVPSGQVRATPRMALGVGAFVIALVAALTIVVTAGHDTLPPIMQPGTTSYTPIAIFFLGASWVFSIVALAVLVRRGLKSILDVWVAVVMWAWIFDIALSAVFNAGRFDLGFYVGRGYGLLAASFVLVVVLLETSGIFSRLAETTAKLQGETVKLRGHVAESHAKQKEIEGQLHQAQKMEAIGNLTGGMAHDFNNLLAIIIGNLDLLVAQRKDDKDVQQLGGEALEAALRGADLTQRLLAFARRQPLQPKRIELNQQISSITRLLTRTLGENIETTLDLDPQLWPVVIDPAQLDASLANLATNARDAMPNGGSLIIVTSNRHLDADYAAQHPDVTPGDYAMIEVSDTGMGMDGDTATRIFEPFFTTKDQGKGTGLGLSMVYGFVKQSGGHINVYSERGIGTTFRLYLPRADTGATTKSEPLTSMALEGQGETILAVEDNPSLRRVVVRQLRELGYRVLEAENEPSAIAVLENDRVDLLFTDVVMAGGLSGIDLAHQARGRWPEIRVLVTSGFPDVKVNGNGNGNGHRNGKTPIPWPLLNKPYRKEDLARAIREALST